MLLLVRGSVAGLSVKEFTIAGRDCVVVEDGVVLQCVFPGGVGGNYSVQVSYDGGLSASSADRLWYAFPVVNRLDGGGVESNTTGMSSITLHGSYFGHAGVARNVSAWAVPPQTQSLEFHASSCQVLFACSLAWLLR
jgi:hypothetical protein